MDELERLRKENEELRERLRLQEQKIDLLIRQLYGSKSERLDPGQLELLLGKEPLEEDFEPKKAEAPATPSDASEGEAAGAKKSKTRRVRLPENLPVVEEVIEPEPVKGCPEAWRCIGQEISELLDFEPAHFFRRRLIRPKYVRRADKEVAPIIARLPEKVIEGGLPAPGLLAQVIVAKYVDHLPLYRQEGIYRARHGVELPRQTLSRWVEAGADWCAPIYREMMGGLKAGGCLQVDETPVRYLEPGTGKAQQGYLWCYSSPGGDVIFDWQAGRSHGCLIDMLGEDGSPDPAFEGVIQCDGYGAYPTYAKKNSGVTLAGCWAHVRRKFYEAQQEAPGLCGRALEAMGRLYRIERDLREARAGPGQRAAIRAEQSRPVIDKLYELLTHQRSHHLPRGGAGKAIAYALGQWPMLKVYLEDGRIEIDNNLCENAIRPTAVGKKNWLFVGAEGAGWKSAILYSITESCRRRGIDPYAYLKDVLTRLPTMKNHQVPSLTPSAWAKRRPSPNHAIAS